MKQEILRKISHFFLIFIPIIYCQIGKWPSLALFGILSFFVISLDYLRHRQEKIGIIFNKIFGSILRKHELESNNLCGASFVALAACLNFFLFKKQIAVTSFLILVICDGVASLAGKAIPSRQFFEKTFAGFLAFIISGTLVIIICGNIFHPGFWFYLFGIFALFCSAIIESRPTLFKVDDNFSVPISFGLILSFFDIVWNYSY